MAGATDNGKVSQISLTATYTLPNPAAQAYLELRRSSYDQSDDGDDATEDHVLVGFRWTFGADGVARRTNRPKLPTYLEWATVSDGHLD